MIKRSLKFNNHLTFFPSIRHPPPPPLVKQLLIHYQYSYFPFSYRCKLILANQPGEILSPLPRHPINQYCKQCYIAQDYRYLPPLPPFRLSFRSRWHRLPYIQLFSTTPDQPILYSKSHILRIPLPLHHQLFFSRNRWHRLPSNHNPSTNAITNVRICNSLFPLFPVRPFFWSKRHS